MKHNLIFPLVLSLVSLFTMHASGQKIEGPKEAMSEKGILRVYILREFKPFGRKDRSIRHTVWIKKIEIPFSALTDKTTIGELKQVIAQWGDISEKKLKGSVLFAGVPATTKCEDNQTYLDCKIKEYGYVDLVLPSSAVADFFRTCASLPGAAVFSIVKKIGF